MNDIQRQIAKYSEIEAGLATLKEKHLNVVIDVSTDVGLKAAKAGRAELRAVRLNLEDARVEEKAASLAYGRYVDAEAARIKAVIEPMELQYDNAIKAEEKRIKDAEAERLRLMAEEAARVKAEEDRIKAEEEAKIQAEKDRIAAEERKKFEEEQAKLKAEKEAFEAEKAKIEADRKAQQDKIDAENAKIEAEKKAIQEKADAEERAETEKIEREKRLAAEEKARQIELKKQKKMDGLTLLNAFVSKHSKDAEFAEIAQVINNWLVENETK